jgi:tetratricopeptide (TPR) repeat protein
VESFGSNRWFIQCEGSSSPQGLVSVIAKCLGLSGNKLFERIILFFETQKTVLLLDNFETPWETIETREEIERMLSRLAAIKTLTLLVTMRGCERPFGTAWTRPVIAPLTPLDLVASRLTFIDISDTSKDDPNLEELLKALDNLPLAITLMARQAQSQPPGVLLERWYSQNTAMLTVGPRHRLSSLEISIKISLDGPRMRNNPYATRLLRILALLPQGSKDLKEIAPGIPNVHSAAAVLEQVGLAHVDGIGSLRVLAPVRRFIVQNYPPDADSWQPVQRHFEALATMSSKIERGMEGQAIVDRLSSQTSNMQAVFERSLDTDGADYRRVIRAAINLTDLFKYTGLGSLTTVIKSSAKAEAIGDKALLADCIRSEAEIHYSRSSQELATAGFEKALRLYRGLDGEYFSEQGRCTMMLGMVESQAGNYADAIANIECAIELHRRAKDVIGEVSNYFLVSHPRADTVLSRQIVFLA